MNRHALYHRYVFLPRRTALASSSSAFSQDYVLIGWSESGMHCANKDFSKIALMPPGNTVRAQVIHRIPDRPPKGRDRRHHGRVFDSEQHLLGRQDQFLDVREDAVRTRTGPPGQYWSFRQGAFRYNGHDREQLRRHRHPGDAVPGFQPHEDRPYQLDPPRGKGESHG